MGKGDDVEQTQEHVLFLGNNCIGTIHCKGGDVQFHQGHLVEDMVRHSCIGLDECD